MGFREKMGLLGGLLKKGPEKPDYSMLEEYFNKPLQPAGYNGNAPNIDNLPPAYVLDEQQDGEWWDERGIFQFPTPEGPRFYGGQHYGSYSGGDLSGEDAYNRMLTYPSDSLTTPQVNQFYNARSLFDK
tara:strand:+ start:235 stop:621 length:387 start_codon:yes stop_codon:yes gene_type:complete